MNYLACAIGIIFFSLLSTFSFLLINLSYSDNDEKAIHMVSSLVQLPNISLSTPFNETRIKEYSDSSNDFYFNMKQTSYIGFVYAY